MEWKVIFLCLESKNTSVMLLERIFNATISVYETMQDMSTVQKKYKILWETTTQDNCRETF